MISFIEEFEGIRNELADASDRAVGVIGGAIVEAYLDTAVRDSLLKPTYEQRDFFNSNGPLGDFGAKITLGYLLGLYSENFMKDLTTIRKIRNRFAHTLEPLSFSNQQIDAWCRNLNIIEEIVTDQKSGAVVARGEQAVVISGTGLVVDVTDRTSLISKNGTYYDPGVLFRIVVSDKDITLADAKQRFETTVSALSTFLHYRDLRPPLPVPDA